MISVPIFVFVLLCLSPIGHIVYIIFWWFGRKIDKKEYERYLEEEYGEKKDKQS